MSTKTNQTKGFTIIEVVLVLAIAALIFLLVFLALPALQRSRRDTQRRDDIGRVLAQIQTYQANNNGKVPAQSNPALASFVTAYMTNAGDDFADPSTGSTYSILVPSAGSTIPQGQIWYNTSAKCDGEAIQAVAGGGNKVAVRIDLEGAGSYCADNS